MNSKIESMLPDNAFWKYFLLICSVPHPSGHEEKLRDVLIAEALKYNLTCRVDSAGNLAIDRPAAQGFEELPCVILQAHLDMVPQVAPGVEFDFLRDAVVPQVEGDWVTTNGRTTLGADDGMGVALAMELLTDKNLQCGALRGVFTVCEEIGLGGAEDIDKDFLDAAYLINLDSDEPFVVGCAGGARLLGRAIPQSQPGDISNCRAVKFTLKGMHGGHSGVDIHLNVGSATVVMGRFLAELNGFKLSAVNAGTLHNAIARSAEAVGLLPENQLENTLQLIARCNQQLNAELIPDPQSQIELAMEITETVPEKVLTPDAQTALLSLWNALPHGLLDRNPDGSSETSCNLAVINGSAGNEWCITMLMRSVYNHCRDRVTLEAQQLMQKYNFNASVDSAYSSWEPKWDAPFLRYACKIYREMSGKEARLTAIHGGLEPGMFCGMNPDLQMISFAPETSSVHSPQEKLSISDSEKTRKLLRNLVERIKEIC